MAMQNMNLPQSTDLIVTWPSNCDYPLWRSFVRENRKLFEQVIVVFHNTNTTPDFRNFIVEAMASDDVVFIIENMVRGDSDWRNNAVRAGLDHSQSEWVWFTEQDFQITDLQFWEDVKKGMKMTDSICVMQGDRIHPCCLFVKRDMVEQTTTNFSVIPSVSDHFAIFTGELQKMVSEGVMSMWILTHHFHHMNGLSHNLRLMMDGQEVTYYPDEFYEYLISSLKASVPLDPRYVEYISNYVLKLGKSL